MLELVVGGTVYDWIIMTRSAAVSHNVTFH